jgi:hypothetical protein
MILALIEKHGIPLASLGRGVGRGGILSPSTAGLEESTERARRPPRHAHGPARLQTERDIAYEIAARSEFLHLLSIPSLVKRDGAHPRPSRAYRRSSEGRFSTR